jgi:hypothetical protein
VIEPGFKFTGQVTPRVTALLEEIRKTTIGAVMLTVDPLQADVLVDGVPFTTTSGLVPFPAGEHEISARQAGYRADTQRFTVTPGATTDVRVALERVSATIAMITTPPDVQVFLDGVSRGSTTTGPASPEYADAASRLGVPPSSLSQAFTLSDISTGSHVVEFRRDCYVSVERRVNVEKPADFRLDPVKLDRAVAIVNVQSSTPGAFVFVDGQERGGAPLTLNDLCEGPHIIEVRTPRGRYLRRLDAKTGDKVSIVGTVKPAFAVLSVTGLPAAAGPRGVTDLGLAIERVFESARTVTLFTPPPEVGAKLLQTEQLLPDWLAVEATGQGVSSALTSIAPTARVGITSRLAKALDVQGVASVTVQGSDRNNVVLALLAAGSTSPDLIEIRLDNPDFVARAIAGLDAVPAPFRPSVGMLAIDVEDAAGAVVVSVDSNGAAAKGGLAAGDVILRVNGQAVPNATRFEALLSTQKAGDRLAIEATDRPGAAKKAELVVTATPRLIGMQNQSLLFNKLMTDFRLMLASPADAYEEAVAHLNLAVALMRVGNWQDAQAELERVKLPAGPGVSDGTVQYLIGVVQEAQSRFAEAEAAWTRAAGVEGSLLTEDGPAIKDLAESKINTLRNRTRPAGLGAAPSAPAPATPPAGPAKPAPPGRKPGA